LDFVSFSETGWPKEAGRDEPDSIDEELGIVDVFVEVGSDYHVEDLGSVITSRRRPRDVFI